MILRLASPSICVIDDEPADYEPMLKALLRLGLGCVHVKGDTSSSLPRNPFRGLRVVFMDLHLSTHVGKDAASHAAKVFSKVVSQETAPVLVVIWSKYKDDVLNHAGEETEADLFKRTLLDSFTGYEQRLVFLELPKPHADNRPAPAKWVNQLQNDIQKDLDKVPAFDALWAWEVLVREAALGVTEGLTALALKDPPTDTGASSSKLPEELKIVLRLLVREQGGRNSPAESAPRALNTVLGQALLDHLEHSEYRTTLDAHGSWLSDQSEVPKTKRSKFAPAVNGYLLTSAIAKKAQPFTPGTVYRLAKPEYLTSLFGITHESLCRECYEGKDHAFQEWYTTHASKPVVVELSPACDVHQGKRRNALMIGGLIFPTGASKNIKRADSIELLPAFSLRWSADDFATQDVILAFFSRLKATHLHDKEPRWLKPWFRLRELPTASLCNWQAAHSARVGYVSLR